jgi:hypothetical protein
LAILAFLCFHVSIAIDSGDREGTIEVQPDNIKWEGSIIKFKKPSPGHYQGRALQKFPLCPSHVKIFDGWFASPFHHDWDGIQSTCALNISVDA